MPDDQASVARGIVNTLDSPPVLWGLRLLQDVQQIAGREESYQVTQGDFGQSQTRPAYEDTNEVEGLYNDGSGGFALVCSDLGTATDVTRGYANNAYDVGASGGVHRFLLDLFNTPEGDQALRKLFNAMLRKMVKAAPTRTGTWKVKESGDFLPQASVEEVTGQFPTEEMLLVCHLYVKWQGKYVNVLNAPQEEGESAWTRAGNDKEDYEKWRKMGEGRPSSSSQNVLQPGINHLVAVFVPTPEGEIEIEEVCLDGDRMVLE